FLLGRDTPTAAHEFDEDEEQAPAVQHRDRQEVQDAEADADARRQQDQRLPARLVHHFARRLGDADRARERLRFGEAAYEAPDLVAREDHGLRAHPGAVLDGGQRRLVRARRLWLEGRAGAELIAGRGRLREELLLERDRVGALLGAEVVTERSAQRHEAEVRAAVTISGGAGCDLLIVGGDILLRL